MSQIVFIAGGPGASGNIVGPENVVYLEIGGNDATGARGNAALPFATLAAAVATAVDGDQIRIGPGVFNIPATVTILLPELHIIGSGPLATRLVGTAGLGANPAISISNFARRVSVAELAIDTTAGTGECVVIDGVGGAGATLNQGGEFTDLELRCDGGVEAFRSVDACASGVGLLESVKVASGDVTLSSSPFAMRECSIDTGTLSIGYVTGVDAPTRALQYMEGLFVGGNLDLEDAISVLFTADCVVVGDIGGILTVQGANDPSLRFYGKAASLVMTLPDTANVLTVDISEAQIGGVIFDMTAPAANAQTVVANGLQMVPAGLLRARAGVNIVARDTNLTSAQLSTPDATGSIVVTQMSFPSTAIGVGAGTAVVTGWRSGSLPIDVAVAPVVVATGPCAHDAPNDTVTTVQLIATVAGNVTFTVFW